MFRSLLPITRWATAILFAIALASRAAIGQAVIPADDSADSAIYDIPKMARIEVDGKGSDWGDRGFRVDVMSDTSDRIRPKATFDGSFRLAWDDRGLLAFICVNDNIPHESANPFTGGDAVELFISPGRGSANMVQIAIAPGLDPAFPHLRTKVYDGLNHAVRQLDILAAREKVPGGYTLEVLVPWAELRITPEFRRELAFQIKIVDSDGSGAGSQLLWYPDPGAPKDKTKLHRIRLAERPSEPVRAAAYATYVRRHRARVSVLAGGEQAGLHVEVHEGDRILGSGKLTPDFVRPDMCSALISLPMPPRDKPYGTLEVRLDGKPLADLTLPPLIDAAEWLMPYEEFIFKPCVFSTIAFPDGDFEDPSYVEDLIGSYEVRTTYYDADYNPVVRADKPGRYGAIVEVRAEDGHVFKRFCTLFREPKDISWRNANMPVTLKLPKEMGIDPLVLKEQAHSVSEYFKHLVSGEGINRESETAVLLAGLYEGHPGETLNRLSPLCRDQKWWFGLKQKTGNVDTRHLAWLPQGYEASDASKKWPLIVCLHGKGERGDSLSMIKENGLPARMEYDKEFRLPAIVIAPQCPQGEWWSPWTINALVEQAVRTYHVDEDRVYLTGLSMGGYGTWATATEFPDRFAAIVPICGGGDPLDVDRIKHLPVWAFHGGRDSTVPLWETERMVDALRAAGAAPRYTIFPKDGHDSWTDAYATPELYSWLLQQKRSPAMVQANQKPAGAPAMISPAPPSNVRPPTARD